MTSDLKVHVLPVGHSDCIIIEFPDKTWALIDCGAKNGPFTPVAIASSYIHSNAPQDSFIRFVLVTHPDTDHDGGINQFISSPPRKVKSFYYSVERVVDINAIIAMVAYLQEASRQFREGSMQDFRPLRAGDEIPTEVANLSMKVLGPTESFLRLYGPNLRSSVNRNHLSIILEIKYGENVILLCGDATEHSLSQIFRTSEICCPVVFKIPHHGRKNCLGSLKIVGFPEKKTIAIISCPSLDSSAPDKELLEKLWQNEGIIVRCTGLSNHCDIRHAVYLPSEESLTLPSTIERALSSPFREIHPKMWTLCCPDIVISVPQSGPVDFKPQEKPCDSLN